jgi:hypothetical protein
MSSFKCEKCGKTCIDSNDGFISGCKHYPPDVKNDVLNEDLKKESAKEKSHENGA